jgi:hypothetical protein
MSTTVFLGPSLPLSQARLIFPEGDFRPPARHGDVYSTVVNDRPDAIAIIDGVFLQVMSVWHKEILFALEEGVPVYGASSMGALRAAECRPFGMVGVGWIFEQYESGLLDRDDEVAVAHATAEHNFRPLSEPLVNIRQTLSAAVQEEVLSQEAANDLIDVASSIYFPDRSWALLFKGSGLDEPVLGRLRDFVALNRVDQKSLDAQELLSILARREVESTNALNSDSRDWTNANPHYINSLGHRDRWLRRNGAEISPETVARFIGANDPKGPERITRALLRQVALYVADSLDLTPSEEDIATQRSVLLNRLELSEDEVAEFCRQNDIESIDRLVEKDAIEQAVFSWFRASRFKLGTLTLVLDEYRRHGDYVKWAEAALEAQQLTGVGDDGIPLPIDLPVDDIREHFKRHLAETGWAPDLPLNVWVTKNDFNHVAAVQQEWEKFRRWRLLKFYAQDAVRSFHETDESSGDPSTEAKEKQE